MNRLLRGLEEDEKSEKVFDLDRHSFLEELYVYLQKEQN